MSPMPAGHLCASGEVSRETIRWAITLLTAQRGFPPTYREIAAACGFALSTTAFHIDRMERDGEISRVPGISRSLRVLP